MSEDPREQLFSALHRQNQKQKEAEDTDNDEKNRNPRGNIPAFTSIDVAKKLRYKSEDRYVNDRMEKELKAY